MESTKILNGVPARILSYGSHTEPNMSDGAAPSPDYLVLVVPGNPGLIEYYRDFMGELYLRLREEFPLKNIPVVGISHGGHQINGIETQLPNVHDNVHLYDLQGQIKAKVEMLKSLPEKTKLILIGHSIGCKMLMEALKSIPEDIQSRVVKCYLLFPTIEQMKTAPNGRNVWRILPYYHLGAYLFWPFFVLPKVIQWFLLTLYFFCRSPPSCILNATLQLLNKDVYLRIMTLVRAELHEVTDLDVEALQRFSPKLFFYFGTADGWCPLEYAHNIIDNGSDLKYEICSRGFEHAFVIKNSLEMAHVLYPKVKEDIENF